MKKYKISKVLILILIISLGVIFSSCAKKNQTPNDLIKKNFAGKDYIISFNSESLDKPLDDIKYSVNYIPKLPTPQKVGYIFQGWFFDKEFTMPYVDAALKLSMEDIILYPKWGKEKFENNGTYAIEFKAEIVEGTVKKGKATDVYGGYEDFTKAIMKDACQIEKSEDKLLLKIQFDAGALTPFSTNGKVYSVTVNTRMGTDIYVKDKIDSLSDTIKTIYVKIDKWDLSTTLYFDVMWINYHDDRGLSDENRYETTTNYEVAFSLTNIIGFEEAFANPKMPLEEGYYLAKSYFRKENNEETMGAVFNPVYSYIYSDGKSHYKLIKQNLPYMGLVAKQHPLYKKVTDNYHERLMCFVSTVMAFDIDNAYSREVIESEYYPETYNGGYYHKTVTEFHSDEGKFYNIIDLDPDLTKEYIVLTAVSGFMEVADGMGYIRQVLSIDYDNLIKLPECDYKPLSGDFYEYESKFNFYPGRLKDLNDLNKTRDAIDEFGMSIEMPNFYYEALTNSTNYKNKNVFSFSFQVEPTKETSAIRLSESRNIIGKFNVNHRVFGYDVRNGKKLYLDRMNPQAFTENVYNSQLRDVIEIKTGKDIKKGADLNLEDLFRDKINNSLDFNYVKYNAYEINNNKIDFNKKINISKIFKFSKDIAIEFYYQSNIGNSKTILELRDIPDPIIEVKDDYRWTQNDKYRFSKTVETQVGTTVKFPDAQYTWGNVSYDFVQNFYLDEKGKESINPSRTMQFGHLDVQHRLYLPNSHKDNFVIQEENITVVYEMQNEFRERKNIVFEYINKPRDMYIIANSLGEALIKKDVRYREDDKGIKRRVPVNEEFTMGVIGDKFEVNNIKNYNHTEDGYTEDYMLTSYSIYTNSGKKENLPIETVDQIINNINNYLLDKDYAVVYFNYQHGEDRLYIKYLYKVTFSGQDDFNVMTNKTYFSNIDYIVNKNYLIGSNKKKISTMRLDVNRWIDGKISQEWNDNGSCRPKDEGGQYRIRFIYPGQYLVTTTYYVKNSILDVNDSWSTSYSFSKVIDVKNDVGDVKITYKTDSKHPFKDGSIEKTIIANLGEGVRVLGVNSFSEFKGVNKPDGLYNWVNYDGVNAANYKPNQLILGKDFINQFGTDEITLYAKWEHKFIVECDVKEGINPIKVSAHLEENYYKISLPNVRDALVPEDYVFIGWTGGFLNSKIKKGIVYMTYRTDYDTPSNFPDGYFKLKAVFKKVYKVSFDVNTKIADPIRSTTAVDGFKIDDAKNKLKVQIIDNKYKFIGWKVKGTSNVLSKKDFLDYIVNKDTTFEAVFEEI